MTQSEILKLEQLVLKYINNKTHAGKSHSALASFIIEDNSKIYLSHSSVRRYVSALRATKALNDSLLNNNEESLPDPIEEPIEEEVGTHDLAPIPNEDVSVIPTAHDKYGVIDDSYHLHYTKTTFILTTALVDKVYCAYTKKGLNLSGPKVQHMLGLTSEQFKAIVYRLGLTKEDDPYSAYAKETFSDEALYSSLQINVAFLLNLVYTTDGTTATEITKAYKESLILAQNKDLQFRGLFHDLKALLPKIEITPITPSAKAFTNEDVVHLIIPDMHIGLVQDNYNLDIVASKLQHLSNTMASFDNIHVSFMGDIIHSVTGLNHKDSWKNMDANSSGANAIIQPYELLLNFLAGLTGLTGVNIVGGKMIAST